MEDLTARAAVRASLHLFLPQQRRRLALAVALGMATSILDVVGVLLLGLVATLGAASLGETAPPRVITTTLDALGLEGRSTAWVLTVIALSASVFLLAKSVAALYINRRILQFLANRQTEISARLTRAMLAQPLLEVQRRPSNVVAYALTDGVGIATITLLGSAVLGLTELAMLAVLGITLFVLNPLVTLGAVAFFGGLVMFMQRILGRRIARAGLTVAESSIAGRSQIQEALGTFREILVMDRREQYAERVAELRRINSHATAHVAFINLLPKYVLEAGLVVGALLLAGTQFVLTDPATAIGTVTLFLAASTRVLPSILRLQQAVLSLRGAAGGASPTYQLVAEISGDPEHTETPQLKLAAGVTDSGFDGNIFVSHVSVVYPGSELRALDDVSFEAPAGSSVAFVGPSGAGKSTLADVIIGALEQDEGIVTIGAVAPRAAIGRWPGSISYVPQSVYLADANIRANVALGLNVPEIDEAAVWKALSRAHLDEFVRDLPFQLDTEIGEHGTRLSGGQRQRLGLARALYTEPTVLLLDEATSALDTETEHAITETLRGLQGEVTMIVIAHRLSTVFTCDLVLYLEGGRLISAGSFDEVRAAVPRLERQAQLSGL